MKFEDYYHLRQAQEGNAKIRNDTTNTEYTDLLEEYRQIDDIILDFHNEFYVFEDFSNRLYTLMLLIIAIFLLLSFSAFSFLSLTIISLEFFKYFFEISIEKYTIIKIWFLFVGLVAVLVALFAYLLFLRDREYQASYCRNFSIFDKDINKLENFKVRDYRIHWVKCLFIPQDIEYVFETYNSYISYKDNLDKVVNIDSFLSNKFVKSILTVVTTGAIGFLASYNANVQSRSSDFFSKNPQFLFNLSFMVFYTLLFAFLVYFVFYFMKDLILELVDIFIKNSKVTEVRKNRLVYYIHQSRVLKTRRKHNRLVNNISKISVMR